MKIPHQHWFTNQGWARRTGLALASVATLTLSCLIAAACADAAPVATGGLTRVSVSSYQALPPPYTPGHVVLVSAASIGAFEHALRSDHIGTTSRATSSGGCTGGTQYTVVITYKSGRRTTLDAYSCGGSITGNMTGHVEAFVGYLSALSK